jgi:hypothetical protein
MRFAGRVLGQKKSVNCLRVIRHGNESTGAMVVK